MIPHGDDDVFGDRRIEDATVQCPSVGTLHQCAVAHDERNAVRERRTHRARMVKAAARDQCDLDAGIDGLAHRVPVDVRQETTSVEQRAVNIDRDQSDGHGHE